MGQVEFICGIAKDTSVHVRELPVTIEKIGKLYIPEPSYFNAEPLPEVWINIFNDNFYEPE